eukprot:403357676
MQIFNLINSRKLGEKDYNVLQGLLNNKTLIFVFVISIAAECLLVQYGGSTFRVGPLSYQKHLMCIAIGSFTIIYGVIVKDVLPARWFAIKKIQEQPIKDEEQLLLGSSSINQGLRTSQIQAKNKTDIQ